MAKTKEINECEDFFEYRKQFSSYHFDHTLKDTQDQGMFKCIAKFQGDWDNEVASLVKDEKISQRPVTEKRKQQHDLYRKYGGDAENTFDVCQIDSTNFPKLWQIAESLGMDHWYAKVHVQRPGQMIPMHLDKAETTGNTTAFDKDKDAVDENNMVRCLVFLDDWYPGQFVMLGQTIITWNRGDAFWFSLQDAPHATANAGHKNRPMLVVTGVKGKKFAELSDNYQEIQV